MTHSDGTSNDLAQPLLPPNMYICDCGTVLIRLSGTEQPPCLACESYQAVEQMWCRGTRFTTDEFEDVLSLAGRNHEASLVHEAWTMDVIDKDTLTACLGPAWCAVEYPDLMLDWDSWRAMFQVVGYTVDGHTAARPVGSVRLYRAAPPAHRHGHSWTEDRDVARSFLVAGRRSSRHPNLWSAVVTPDRLLARLEQTRTGGTQYVVETDGLSIEPDREP